MLEQLHRCFPMPTQQPVRMLRRTGKEAPALSLLDAPPGVHLLVGEAGLGKSTLLGELGRVALERGRRVLASFEPNRDLPPASDDAVVLIDGLRKADEPEVRVLRHKLPRASIIVACEPALATLARHGIPASEWRLQPLALQDSLQIWKTLPAAHVPLLPWAKQTRHHEALIGVPLFLALASHLEGECLLPRMSDVAMRYLDQILSRLGSEKDDIEAILIELAVQLIERDCEPFQRDAIKALLDAPPRQHLREARGWSVDALIDKLVSIGLIRHSGRGWCRFHHFYLPRVLVARARGQRGEVRFAAREAPGSAQEVALLVPAFCIDPMAALEQACAGDSSLWLRAVGEMPQHVLGPGLRSAFGNHLRLDAPDLGDELRKRREAVTSGTVAGLVGLMEALVLLRSRDARFLGALQFLLEELCDETPLAKVLVDELLSHLPSPARPAAVTVRHGASSFALSRDVLTNEEVAALGMGIKQGQRSRGDRHPQTEISWLEARVLARLYGGRLPRKAEWIAAAEEQAPPTRVPAWQQANLPDTWPELLSDKGTIAVDDNRLKHGPGCRQLIGNVRQWCEDGPADQPKMRWTLGGSFKYPRDDMQCEEYTAVRVDIGVRVAFDQIPVVAAVPDLPALPPTAPTSSSFMPPRQLPGRGKCILILSDEWLSHHGGISTFNRMLCIALAEEGHTVYLHIPPRALSPAEREEIKKYKIILVDSGEKDLPIEAELTHPLSLPGLPEVIIGHGLITGPYAEHQRRKFFPSAQLVYFVHVAPDEVERASGLSSFAAAVRAEDKDERQVEWASKADLVVTLGPYLADAIKRSLYEWQADGRIVHCVNPWLFTPPGAALRPPEDPEVLLIGRMKAHHLKGLAIAQAALDRLSPRPPLALRGVTQDDSREMEQKYESEIKTGKMRIYPYRVEEKYLTRSYRKAGVMVMPSRTEGFGLTGFEAICYRVPVLVSSKSGLGQMLTTLSRETKNARLRSPVVEVTNDDQQDARRWADKIRDLLSDQQTAFNEAALLYEDLVPHLRAKAIITRFIAAIDSLPSRPADTPTR
jgi:glycosyltransferase involved in cell wall biosynthesis